jgi:hypothetical protein
MLLAGKELGGLGADNFFWAENTQKIIWLGLD